MTMTTMSDGQRLAQQDNGMQSDMQLTSLMYIPRIVYLYLSRPASTSAFIYRDAGLRSEMEAVDRESANVTCGHTKQSAMAHLG